MEIINYGCFKCLNLREKKRERERDDLWRKMQDLSLKNAAKEGISLGKSHNFQFVKKIIKILFVYRYGSNEQWCGVT